MLMIIHHCFYSSIWLQLGSKLDNWSVAENRRIKKERTKWKS